MLISRLTETILCMCLWLTVSTSYIYPKSHYSDNNYKQSRYSKFNKVMTRINKLSFEDEGVYKLRHKGWAGYRVVSTTPTTTTTTTTEMDLFETYGELDGDYFDDDYDNTDDEEDELEYEDEENELFGEIQAEEPTEKPTSTAAPRTVSKLTEYKWSHYGTRDRVEESMRNHLNLKPSPEQLKVKAVIDHYARVNQQSVCKSPLPRVIPVQQEHPDPKKSYIPACTVLYRCADDSGCCKRDTTCQYKNRDLVQLYFYAKVIGKDNTTIEKLEFYNHTECACKEKYPENNNNKDKVAPKYFDTSNLTTNRTVDINKSRCNCPAPYQATSFTPKCVCDCDLSNEDCIQLKKGKEHFSMINRMCIQENDCGLPACEYGAYMLTEGKCPTKQDKLEEFRKMRIN